MSKTEKAAHLWERDGLDWYVEPEVATAKLLSKERFVGPIHDPSCGGGNIVRACIEAGYDASGSDIVTRVDPEEPWFLGEYDFLTTSEVPTFANVVMNPPFFRAKGAEAFIRKAISVTRGKVCAFVDVKFLAGTGRANGLFSEHKPTRIWIITPRVSCPPGEYLLRGGKASGGTADWCWIVWDMSTSSGSTELGWLL
ncbi:hypothetical protein [Hoeflea sp.]|uniref:hypothetical protein n=1 Tax=Hoeflea sp. TaxID=1940281 RepID=UPI003B52C50A